MEVVSIADYELARSRNSNKTPECTIGRLEASAQVDDATLGMTEIILYFGAFTLDQTATLTDFGYEPPKTCKSWPWPQCSGYSVHQKVGKPATFQKHRKHRRPDEPQSANPPRRASKSKAPQESDSAPQASMPAPPRDPPLHLLSLPPEIRNAIWTLLAARKEPIQAQIRRIHPCRKLSKFRGKLIRRFPKEPPSAAVNRQLRRELLSIFYGNNCFVFENNACSMFRGYGMLSSAMMQKWKPQQDSASFISHLLLHFNALPRVGGMVSIVYALRRLRNGEVTTDVLVENSIAKTAAQSTEFCLCSELEIAKAVEAADHDGDLVGFAMALIGRRLEKIFGGPSVKKIQSHYPCIETCKQCERATFEILYSGVGTF